MTRRRLSMTNPADVGVRGTFRCRRSLAPALPQFYSSAGSNYRACAGGLMSYDAERCESHRQAASCVDRMLKGERPGDLPVQAPMKYESSSTGPAHSE